jgi:SNF2 family DNA or RNA helicase
MDMLPALVEDGRRILLFSQFTSMLDLIKPELDSGGIEFVELRGDTKDRAGPVRRFQGGKVPLFLISLRAGGTGLNLTAADTVIHYDPWWNPAVEDQATDRAYRIGQKRAVQVHKLLTAGTVEEKVDLMLEKKRDLASRIVGQGEQWITELDDAALRDLFSLAPDAVVAGDEADREEGDGTGAPRPGPRRRGRERAGVGGPP